MRRTFIAAALLGAGLIAGGTIAGGEAAAKEGQKLVTIVTSADAQTQLMAMVLTMQAAQQGAAAHIMLCGPAGDIALKQAPESATADQPPRDMSPQGLMLTISKQTGATLQVCAIYLPGKGLEPSALIDGITVAQPTEMAARLMDPDTRVLDF
jgi:predicted peroxiredoxin